MLTSYLPWTHQVPTKVLHTPEPPDTLGLGWGKCAADLVPLTYSILLLFPPLPLHSHLINQLLFSLPKHLSWFPKDQSLDGFAPYTEIS